MENVLVKMCDTYVEEFLEQLLSKEETISLTKEDMMELWMAVRKQKTATAIPVKRKIGGAAGMTTPATKRKPSVYNLYCKEMFAVVKTKHPESASKDVFRLISTQWKALSQEDKDRFKTKTTAVIPSVPSSTQEPLRKAPVEKAKTGGGDSDAPFRTPKTGKKKNPPNPITALLEEHKDMGLQDVEKVMSFNTQLHSTLTECSCTELEQFCKLHKIPFLKRAGGEHVKQMQQAIYHHFLKIAEEAEEDGCAEDDDDDFSRASEERDEDEDEDMDYQS